MSNPGGQIDLQATQAPAPAPGPGVDVESGMTPGSVPASTSRVRSILRRWRRDDLLRKMSLGLRALAFLFSALSFLIIASNRHGDSRDFTLYEEYRYLLCMAILSSVYTGIQAYRQVHQLYIGKEYTPMTNVAMIDYIGDQLISYCLLSSVSSAIPITNKMRNEGDNAFTDSSAAAISMSVLAFIALASSAGIAGYKLSTHSYL